MLLVSGLSKTLIYKHIVPCNYQPIHSDNDWHIFSCAGTTTPTNLVALHKICILEFNCSMVVNEYPVLIVDSMNLHYDIILRVHFLDKCGFHLDYDNNLVQWIEYDIPLCNTTEFFSFRYYSSLLTPIDIDFEDNCPGDAYVDSFATCILDAKYKQANTCNVSFDQQHLLLDRAETNSTLNPNTKLCNGSLGVYPLSWKCSLLWQNKKGHHIIIIPSLWAITHHKCLSQDITGVLLKPILITMLLWWINTTSLFIKQKTTKKHLNK